MRKVVLQSLLIHLVEKLLLAFYKQSYVSNVEISQILLGESIKVLYLS